MKKSCSFPVFWLILLLAASTAAARQSLHLRVDIRDGSTVVPQVDEPRFRWVNIEGAASEEQMIAWKDVRELKLVESPVGDQIERLESLLAQLTSPEYEKREQAEAALGDRDSFGPFESHIRNALPTGDIESDYRVRRILLGLENWSNPLENQFDELILADGTRLLGEASGFSIMGTLFSHPLRLERAEILRVAPSNQSPPAADPKAPAKEAVKAHPFRMRTFNQSIPEFYGNEHEPVISFEKDRFGEPIEIEQDAAELFAADGLLLGTEDAGRVITIRYPFKFCPIDAGRKCVCPFDLSLDEPKRLHGTTLITFCPPGQPEVAAGVHRFGLFLERIEHSRDVVVEAFNARGQMLGMVEATDQICVFAGFESSDLITQIRVAQNQHLPDLERNIDATYALDCFTFDTPVRAVSAMASARSPNQPSIPGRVDFRDGNSLVASDIKFDGDETSFVNPLIGQSIIAPLTDIRSIDFRPSRVNNLSGEIMVQLLDRSIVRTSAKDWLQPVDFPEQRIDRGQVIGLWGSRQPARFGETRAFVGDQPLIVYPGCQIAAAGFEMLDHGFRWDATRSTKIVQQVQQRDEGDFDPEEIDPDLTPKADEIDFLDTEFTPTLWLSQPSAVTADQGYIRLTDGQYIMIGGSSGFELKSLDSNALEIQFGNSTRRYPLNRVTNIRFPLEPAD